MLVNTSTVVTPNRFRWSIGPEYAEMSTLISPLLVWLDEWEHPENYSNPELLRNIAREWVRV